MITDIKHKHAGHVIIIEGQAFKANDAGQWDLTDIWRTLKLPVKNGPAQWRTKQAKRMEAMQNLHSSNGAGSWATFEEHVVDRAFGHEYRCGSQ